MEWLVQAAPAGKVLAAMPLCGHLCYCNRVQRNMLLQFLESNSPNVRVPVTTCQTEACRRNRMTPAALWPSWLVLASETDPPHLTLSPWWSQHTVPLVEEPAVAQTSFHTGRCPLNADQISLLTDDTLVLGLPDNEFMHLWRSWSVMVHQLLNSCWLLPAVWL